MKIIFALLLFTVSAFAQFPYVQSPTNAAVDGYLIQRTGSKNKWVTPGSVVTNVNGPWIEKNAGTGTNITIYGLTVRSNGLTTYQIENDTSNSIPALVVPADQRTYTPPTQVFGSIRVNIGQDLSLSSDSPLVGYNYAWVNFSDVHMLDGVGFFTTCIDPRGSQANSKRYDLWGLPYGTAGTSTNASYLLDSTLWTGDHTHYSVAGTLLSRTETNGITTVPALKTTGNVAAGAVAHVDIQGPGSGGVAFLNLQASSDGDHPVWGQIVNTGGYGEFGVNGTLANNLITDGLAYSTIWGTFNATAVQFITQNIARMNINSDGTVTASSTITATNGLASMATTGGIILSATGITNTMGINATAYVTATAVAFTIKNRANASLYTSPTLSTTISVHLQPGWAVTAASGLAGTLLPD